MKILGLTGKTGAGKTTVSDFLKSKSCFIIDADLVAREVLNEDSSVLTKLSVAFGCDILNEKGELIRSELAKRAFKDEKSTDILNSITHPAIAKNIRQKIDAVKNQSYTACVIDAAVLLDCEVKDFCECIIVVTAPKQIRLERILSRDKINLEQALLRINAQKSDEYYNTQADIIINNFKPYNLKNELEKILKVIT